MAEAVLKTTQHFNQLSESEAERLAILIEEASEVIKCATKILRHGHRTLWPERPSGESNREALERELGDLGHAISRMERNADLNPLVIRARAASKAEHIKPFLHHQQD